jgi:5-keto-L-gluconate epimerase
MKLGLMIGTPDLRQPWCTVLDGSDLKANILQAAEWGYDGIELALRDPDLLDPVSIKKWCQQAGLEMIGLCTGEIYGSDGLGLIDPEPDIMQSAFERMQRVVNLAGEFGMGTMVNIGRVRGKLSQAMDYQKAVEVLQRLSDHARGKSVHIVLEPVNHYEVNFIHSTQDGIQIAKDVDRPNFGLMLDTYHMNIEDQDFHASLKQARDYCWHIHVSDNNRKWPGNAHIEFASIVATLASLGYEGYLSAEILPWPDRLTAGVETFRHMKKCLQFAKDQGVCE